MNELALEDKKRLTEFLDEKHEPTPQDIVGGEYFESRTFSIPQDQHDLFKKLVERRKWEDFWDWLFDIAGEEYTIKTRCPGKPEGFTMPQAYFWQDWICGIYNPAKCIFDPIRFCWLCAKFLEEEKR